MENTIVATIDGESIAVSHFTSYLEALQKDKGKLLLGPDISHLLDRMIDEKLLLQQAQHLGLTRTDSAVKRAIVDAVIENIISKNRGVAPKDKDLATFYTSNITYFSHASLLSVRRMVFTGTEAHIHAQQAHASLERGQTFASVKAAFATEDAMRLPSSLIPQNRLPNYLGPSLARAASELEPGQFTPPLPSGGSLVILGLLKKVPGQTPALEEIRDQVAREYRRRQNDEALRDYLSDLKASADIRINKPLLLQLETPPERE